MDGITHIAAERMRQRDVLKFTAERDAGYTRDELALAASCYALPEGMRNPMSPQEPPLWWPWSKDWWKPGPNTTKGRIRDLMKAGALIAAEIDRLAALGEGE